MEFSHLVWSQSYLWEGNSKRKSYRIDIAQSWTALLYPIKEQEELKITAE